MSNPTPEINSYSEVCAKAQSLETFFAGQYVVVRTQSAGVHVGTLVRKDGTNVLLWQARRLWKWAGAFTLHEVADDGIDPKASRMSKPVPVIELTEAVELLPVSLHAYASMEKCREA